VRHISRALAAEGFTVLSFDFTGLGESEGEFSETGFSSNVDDIVAAAEHLTAHHAPPSILIGHSLGGAAVIAAARRVPSSTAVVTIGAPAGLDHLAEVLEPARASVDLSGSAEVLIGGRRIRIGKALMNDLREFRLADAIAGLDRALLVMHSPADTVVGIGHAMTIFTTAKHPKSLVSLDGADHLLSRPQDSRYAAGIIASWASRYLRELSAGIGLPTPADD